MLRAARFGDVARGPTALVGPWFPNNSRTTSLDVRPRRHHSMTPRSTTLTAIFSDLMIHRIQDQQLEDLSSSAAYGLPPVEARPARLRRRRHGSPSCRLFPEDTLRPTRGLLRVDHPIPPWVSGLSFIFANCDLLLAAAEGLSSDKDFFFVFFFFDFFFLPSLEELSESLEESEL